MAQATREFVNYDENDLAIMEAIGKRIKLSRMLKKLSQGQLAEKSGIKIHTLRAYEAGRVNIPFTSLLKIALALDMDASFVMYGGSVYVGNNAAGN